MTSLKKIVNGSLSKVGLELKRARSDTKRSFFYTLPETCQIGNLAVIYERVFGKTADGFFVEVGAFDGETYSNTSGLADRGWGGILVEPVPRYADLAAKRHQSNPKVRVVRCAIGREEGSVELDVADAFTTASSTMADQYKQIEWARGNFKADSLIQVPLRRLDTVLEEQKVSPGFEVLVIDTEGYEAEVLGGFSIDRWQPRMMIVELSEYHPDFDRRKEDGAVSREIQDAGYEIIFKDDINTVFLRRA